MIRRHMIAAAAGMLAMPALARAEALMALSPTGRLVRFAQWTVRPVALLSLLPKGSPVIECLHLRPAVVGAGHLQRSALQLKAGLWMDWHDDSGIPPGAVIGQYDALNSVAAIVDYPSGRPVFPFGYAEALAWDAAA